MNRYTLKNLLMLLLLIGLLAACRNSRTEPTATPLPPPTETPTPVPTDTPEPTVTQEPTEEPAPEPTAAPDEEETLLPDIYTFALTQPEIAQFAFLIERLDLMEKLQSEGPFTAFIPTNRALEALPAEIQEDDDVLFDVVLYHLVADAITNEELVDTSTVTSMLGDELTIVASNFGAVVQNANLLGVTDQVSNGVLYIIDKVIYPPDLLEYDLDTSQVVGEETLPSMGNLHIDIGERSPIPYNSIPPTSGPHYPNIVAWQVYEDPIRYEQVVHNLEDAGVLIYYQCEDGCPELVTQLTDLLQPLMDAGRHVVLLPNDPSWTVGDDDSLHQDMGAPIVAVAWQKILRLDEVDADKLLAFIDAYEGIDHHARY